MKTVKTMCDDSGEAYDDPAWEDHLEFLRGVYNEAEIADIERDRELEELEGRYWLDIDCNSCDPTDWIWPDPDDTRLEDMRDREERDTHDYVHFHWRRYGWALDEAEVIVDHFLELITKEYDWPAACSEPAPEDFSDDAAPYHHYYK